MSIIKMTDLELKDKRVIIRVDFNVPLDQGKISSEKRLLASIPTIKLAIAAGARVLLLSHLGRPEEGVFNPELSLKPVAEWLTTHLGQPVRLVRNWLTGVQVAPGEVVLGENVRFNKGENKNDPELAQKMAALGDIFVMDAFATAHRAQASTHGIGKFIKIACAGPLLVAELAALEKALAAPHHPLIAIVGGAKVSTKLQLLKNLLKKVDQLLVGGGIANTFMAAAGLPIGNSLYEKEFIPQAQELLLLAQQKKAEIPIPPDVVVAKEKSATATATLKAAAAVAADDIILDIGPESGNRLTSIITNARTIIWNGPVGMFEFPQFAAGTKNLSLAIADSSAFSLAGGGETVAAIEKFGVANKISYISTAGGAFLEYLQGETLPAVALLEERGG